MQISKKIKKLFAIASLGILSSGAIATIAPIVVSCSPEQSTTTDGVNRNYITDNINEIKSQIKNKELTVFNDTSNPNYEPWWNLTSNANAAIYQSIFKTIDSDTIKNDLNIYLTNIPAYNNFIYLNVIKNEISNAKNQNFIGLIQFQVQNKTQSPRKFKLDGINNTTWQINPYEIINFEISFNTNLEYNFLVNDNTNNICNLYANYNFATLTLKVNDQIYTIKNAKLFNYSKSINTIVKDVNLNNDYADIATTGNNFLTTLDIEKIKNDINKTTNYYFKKITQNIDDAQLVAQGLAKNQTLLVFLKENANAIANLITNNVSTKTFDIKLLNKLIAYFLQDKTITQILSDNKIYNNIKELVSLAPQEYQSIILYALSALRNEQGIDEIHKLLSNQVFEQILGKEFIDKIPELKTKGLMSFIFENSSTIIKLISAIPSISETITSLSPIINFINQNINNQSIGIIDLIVECIKTNPETSTYFKTLIANLTNNNQTIVSLLDQIIFNNPNFNSTNLINLIDVFANPRATNSASGDIIKYSNWYNSIEKTTTYNNETANYNQKTHELNLETKYQFIFKQDIYFQIEKIYDILPPSISLNNTTIPISSLKSLLPKWFSINTNDYFNYSMNYANTKLNYNVNQYLDHNYLNWNGLASHTFDVNLPQSIKTLVNTSGSLMPASVIISLSKNILYHQFSNQSIFNPSPDTNNPQIADYNYNTYNGQAILINTITDTRKQEIKQTIIDATINEQIANTEYSWKGSGIFASTYKVSKTKINSSFVLEQSLINELFNLEYYNGDISYELEVQQFIPETSVLGLVTIPSVWKISIKLHLPYNVYTNINTTPTATIILDL